MAGSCKVLQNLIRIRLEINNLITLLVLILVIISVGVFFNFLLSTLPELYWVLDRGRERAQLFCLGHKDCMPCLFCHECPYLNQQRSLIGLRNPKVLPQYQVDAIVSWLYSGLYCIYMCLGPGGWYKAQTGSPFSTYKCCCALLCPSNQQSPLLFPTCWQLHLE